MIDNKKQVKQTNTSLYFRLITFIILFVAITGITGPYIVSSRLLYGFGFYIYGNLGKLALFSCVALFLLIRNKKITLEPIQNAWWDYLLVILGLLLIPVFFTFAPLLLTYPTIASNLQGTLLLHALLVSIPLLCLIGVFTPKFLIGFIQKYWKMLGIGILCAIFYDISIFYIWNIWPFLSNIVLQIMAKVFSLTEHTVYVIPPRTLFVKNFAVEIAEACSGIDSMYLLLTLYLLIVGIDWKILNKTKAVIFFIPFFIGMFLINILRVYILIYLGIFFGPKITLELFHTYLGLVLFLIYFLLFLQFGYKRLQNTNSKI